MASVAHGLIATLLALVVLAQPPTYRSAVDLVRVVATVSDGDGHAVTNLDRDAFEIRDEGTLQTIDVFTRDAETPLSVVILVDVSRSMKEELDAVRAGIRAFLGTMQATDETALVTFDADVHVLGGLSPSHARLISQLDAVTTGGGTALFEAIETGARLLQDARGAKKVLLLVTDGNNTIHSVTQRAATRAIEQSEALVYALAIGHSGRPTALGRFVAAINRPQMSLLGSWADTSGGRAELVDDVNRSGADAVARTIASFGAELRVQYVLGFYPQAHRADGKTHRLQVTTTERHYVVRARKIYVER